MQTFISRLFAAFAVGSMLTALPVLAAPDNQAEIRDAKQPKVYRGARSYGPFKATEVNVDLRNLPPAKKWRPGDPIKVIPKRYRRTLDVDHGPDYDAGQPDALAEKQRAFSARNNKRAARGIGDTRSLSDPIINVAGPGYNGVFPPDTMGEVGKDYYIHMINGGTTVTILNKSDGSQAAQFDLHSLGTGDCADGLGDPVAVYDELAERWFLSEFSNNGNKMCLYISQTSDPIAGGWYFYEVGAADFPDYPKYGVWPDAYYFGTNESTSRLYAIDRAAMLSGLPTTFQVFDAPDLPGFGFQVLQPADLDGATPPPAGTPGYFLRHYDDEWHQSSGSDASQDFIELWEFKVDFTIPTNSAITGPINVGGFAEFDSELCDAAIFACFTQPSGPPLDPLREVVMFRVGYRNFGTHEAMVGNFVVDVDGTNHGGIRWFEMRRPNDSTPWSLYQEGTFDMPLPDLDNRFMGAIAQDQDGNIALAYNVTSSATFPGMRYTGRLATDPLGVMTHPETSIIEGDASNLLNRWGDYAAMSVDPVDGCTFWHTNMYGTGLSWGTQIASFRFDECGLGATPDFTLNATNLTQQVCSPGDLDPIGIAIGQISGFNSPVTLAYSGLPTGFNGTFTTNPVTPPGSSDANVSVNTIPSDYTFDIVGSAAGVATKSRTANVTVIDAAAGSTSLVSPADGSPNESPTPVLSWTAASNAAEYLVEVDDNADFSSVEYSFSTPATSHQVATPLMPAVYFWRVTPTNACGDGAISVSSSFTVTGSLCSTGGQLTDAGTVVFPLAVGDPGTITDLDVSLNITHSYIGDLDITLSDGTTSVDLILSPAAGACSNADIVATLDDEAVLPVTTACDLINTPAINGTFMPETGNFLSDFDTKPLAANWTLTITDNVSADSGSLNEFCLIPTVDLPPPPDADSDGIFDDNDNCPAIANADQNDVDNDNVGDVCDNCLNEPNTDQCNTNSPDDDFGNLCDADLNNDGIVNSSDLSIMRSNFGQSGPGNDADLNCDDIVNSADLSILRGDFGQAPGPTGIQ